MKRLVIFIVFCFGLLTFIVLIINVVIYSETKAYIYSDLREVPVAQAALIPGAGILKDGSLSPILTDRVDMAIKLYEAEKVSKILVSGDNSTIEYNEVSPIRSYLIDKGVPDKDIFLDYAGFDTYSTMYRARDIFSVSSVIITTQSFHLPRSVFILRRLGIEAYGASADVGNVLFQNYVREIFANEKAALDLLFNREPKFLGDKISIVDEVVEKPTETEQIRIDSPSPNQIIQSPLTITGEARGTWFFEASFPIFVTNWDGLIIGQAVAQAKTDWMTEDFVPFEATLTFTVDQDVYSNKGTLIFKKDNPSGLPEHDDAIEIPVILGTEKESDDISILPFGSGATGRVLLGPVCPVMRIPPDPDCTDKGYKTAVQVIKKNSTKSSLIASVETDKDGNYKVMLPPGQYRLQALGGQPFPSCEWAEITIEPDAMLTRDLSCDTGIR